jgi:hypothetical protein
MKRHVMVIAGVIVCAVLGSALPASAGTTWRAQFVPTPANSTAKLQGVSCPARGDCTAVGSVGDRTTGAEATLAEQWNGRGWAIQPTPSLTGQATFLGVSCLSATDCTAFGTQQVQPASALIEHWDGTSWTVQPSPTPVGSTEADLVGGSCTSPASCTAVGLYDPSGGPGEQPLAEFWDGTSWTLQHVPMPAGASVGSLDGVSCPSATRCIAAGGYRPKLGSGVRPFVARWNGTAWTARTVPMPAGALGAFLTGVSCTSPSGCTAVGDFDNADGTAVPPYAARWDGTTWTVQAVNAPDGGFLRAVSCTSGTSCTAVGDLSNTGLAEHWDGTSWTVQPTPVPRHGTAHIALLFGVSCLSATYCTAAGLYNAGRPLADHE